MLQYVLFCGLEVERCIVVCPNPHPNQSAPLAFSRETSTGVPSVDIPSCARYVTRYDIFLVITVRIWRNHTYIWTISLGFREVSCEFTLRIRAEAVHG